MARKGENIYKRKDGRWEGRYIKGRDIYNKAIYGYVYAQTYSEVRSKLITAKANKESNRQNQSPQVFSDWIDLWIEKKRQSVKHSTYIRYQSHIDLHIKPKLGSIKCESIDTELLQSFFFEQANKGRVDDSGGLSSKTLTDLLMIIKSILNFAKTRGETIKCDVTEIEIKKSYKKMRILSFDEERRLNIVLLHNQDIYKLGTLVCLYTGIRIGELCALKWENFLFDEKILRINKTMQRIQCENEIGKTNIIISDPKSNCSIRQIPLPDFLISELKKYKGEPNNFFFLLAIRNIPNQEPCNIDSKDILQKQISKKQTFIV